MSLVKILHLPSWLGKVTQSFFSFRWRIRIVFKLFGAKRPLHSLAKFPHDVEVHGALQIHWSARSLSCASSLFSCEPVAVNLPCSQFTCHFHARFSHRIEQFCKQIGHSSDKLNASEVKVNFPKINARAFLRLNQRVSKKVRLYYCCYLFLVNLLDLFLYYCILIRKLEFIIVIIIFV